VKARSSLIKRWLMNGVSEKSLEFFLALEKVLHSGVVLQRLRAGSPRAGERVRQYGAQAHAEPLIFNMVLQESMHSDETPRLPLSSKAMLRGHIDQVLHMHKALEEQQNASGTANAQGPPEKQPTRKLNLTGSLI